MISVIEWMCDHYYIWYVCA